MTGVQRVAVLMLCLGLSASAVRAQDASALRELGLALAAGDAEAVLADAEDRIELALVGQRRSYNRRQAVYVLKEFFRRHPPEAFEVDHRWRDATSGFATGRYAGRGADWPLRVYVRLHRRADRWRLASLRITSPAGT